MSRKKKAPKPKVAKPFNPTPAQAEQIKRDFDEAEKIGDPLVAIAKEIAKMENIITIQGESLGTLIPDKSVPLDVGKYLSRPPDFVVTPDGAVRNIKSVTEPAFVRGGLEVHPERMAREWAIVNGATCPTCGDTSEKIGWNVEAPDTTYGLLVLQCLKCHQYLCVERGKPETEEPTDEKG